jgi:hypothetical protein
MDVNAIVEIFKDNSNLEYDSHTCIAINTSKCKYLLNKLKTSHAHCVANHCVNLLAKEENQSHTSYVLYQDTPCFVCVQLLVNSWDVLLSHTHTQNCITHRVKLRFDMQEKNYCSKLKMKIHCLLLPYHHWILRIPIQFEITKLLYPNDHAN